MTKTYESQVKEVMKLRSEKKYKEEYEKMSKLSCKHLTPVEHGCGLKEISSISRGWGPQLKTLAEEVGNRGREERKIWFEESKATLSDIYKCNLTGDYCVARKDEFHSSSVPSGDYPFVYVKIDIQKRCPAFENNF